MEKVSKKDGWIPQPPEKRTGKRVAVVGSGEVPAGLATAAQLNKAGHSVTVYDRFGPCRRIADVGIPTMKLDKNVVQRRVDLLEAEGIQFITNTEIGEDICSTTTGEM